ncbi:F-box domain protein [Fructobacillus ficulneus]|uniref:F-box domain protein n=1 Tax=Fructobacillus ficulneus TaxID=157463 RepID=A0A0K8MFA6_9LACO|nr:F-box domain protein [Fructobacillus ficulneus]
MDELVVTDLAEVLLVAFFFVETVCRWWAWLCLLAAVAVTTAVKATMAIATATSNVFLEFFIFIFSQLFSLFFEFIKQLEEMQL